MPRYKVTIEYDGTGLVGYQKQPNQISVQSIVEEAIYGLSQERVNIVAAGRTDAGVHAYGQVIHFDLDKEFDENNITNGINFHMQEKPVAALKTEIVDEDFHARFLATKRHYIYKILNRQTPTILEKNRVWQMPYNVDFEAMKKAAKYLEGNHDFSSFRASECQARTPVKTIDEIRLEYVEGDAARGEGDYIYLHVSALSFLHHMVRNITGTLVDVGKGKIKAEDIPKIIEAKDRTKAGQMAPASGLYLVKVDY